MAGVDIDLILLVTLFLFTVWSTGRMFKQIKLPPILGEFAAGVFLGPNCLDLVPYASDGSCPQLSIGRRMSSSSGSASAAASGSIAPCKQILMFNNQAVPDIWSFIGTVGVTMLIMESGMHINFEKVRQVGKKALVVAIIGTGAPLLGGMVLVSLLSSSATMYPQGFAAGCALAPTSVGISIKLLDDAKMLNSMAGQTVLTAAFVDDVFSLVLLVLLDALASGDAQAGDIILTTFYAFLFLGGGVVLANYVYPKMTIILDKIPTKKAASIQPRDEVQLLTMIGSLVFYSWIGSLIGSHLLGAFVAGMAYVKVPRSHQIWVAQFKRILKWAIRIFFGATVGFAVPLQTMLTGSAFANGLALGIVPAILLKVVAGVAARTPYPDAKHKQLAAKASKATCGGAYQPLQYLVGMAMVARGEFAFLVARQASTFVVNGERMLDDDTYAMVTWSLVWALVSAPFLFRWALKIYGDSNPVERSTTIGGTDDAGSGFVIRVIGEHHTGILREMLNALHAEGVDVLESKMDHDGVRDIAYFVVTSRGVQKDFDNEKLEDIRHHLSELVNDKSSQVTFEPISIADHMKQSSALEIQLLSRHSEATLGQLTDKMEALGLVVQEAGTESSTQIVHGHEKKMAHHMFQVCNANGRMFQTEEAAKIREALQPVLAHDGGEAIVKLTKAQSFDWAPHIKPDGHVWEVAFSCEKDEKAMKNVTNVFNGMSLNVLYSRLHRKTAAEGGGVVSSIHVERDNKSDLSSSEVETLKSKLTVAIGVDVEAADIAITLRKLDPAKAGSAGFGPMSDRRGSMGNFNDAAAVALAKVEASEHGATPVVTIEPEEVGRGTAKVAPEPEGVTAVDA